MIQPGEVARLAHRLGLGDKTIEKDYVLTRLLLAIANSPLRDRLAFKEGTAIKKIYEPDYRFSEDLDFTLPDDTSNEELAVDIEGHGFALRVNCFDIYECPDGFLLHTYMDNAPNWAVTGKTLKDMLAAAPDQSVARRAHGLLVQKNLVSVGH